MWISRRLEEARRAFRRRDREGAAAAHDPGRMAASAEERHGGAASQYVGDMVYGGLDGILTSFAVVSGVAGAALGTRVLLVLGLSNLFADGFAMGIGALLSLKSEKEYYDRELRRETWEMEHYPDGERRELLEIYRRKGYSEEDAQGIVGIQTRDKGRWVEAMMVEELGLIRDERRPLWAGLATFLSFAAAGALPLLFYLAVPLLGLRGSVAFPLCVGLTAVGLFALGAAKVRVTGMNPLRSGLEMLAVGGLAAGVAYGVGALLGGSGG